MGEIFQFGEDSRLKGYRNRISHPTLPLERTFCSNCTEPYGWASVESSQMIAAAEIIVLCPKCEHELSGRCGPIPLEPVPAEDMRALGLLEGNAPPVQAGPKAFPRLGKLQCPECGKTDFHLEDNPDNPEGPQVAICHHCSTNGGTAAAFMRKGWLLRERVTLIEPAAVGA
jgi:hypothetical protein